MIGTTFPYLDYLPKPLSVKGIQIDIKGENIGIRYPIEIGLRGDAKSTLSELLKLVKTKENCDY